MDRILVRKEQRPELLVYLQTVSETLDEFRVEYAEFIKDRKEKIEVIKNDFIKERTEIEAEYHNLISKRTFFGCLFSTDFHKSNESKIKELVKKAENEYNCHWLEDPDGEEDYWNDLKEYFTDEEIEDIKTFPPTEHSDHDKCNDLRRDVRNNDYKYFQVNKKFIGELTENLQFMDVLVDERYTSRIKSILSDPSKELIVTQLREMLDSKEKI